jgi:hypothetical protein
MVWDIGELFAGMLLGALLTYIVFRVFVLSRRRAELLRTVVLLRALVTHVGPEKTAQYYLEAIDVTRNASLLIHGLCEQAEVPEESQAKFRRRNSESRGIVYRMLVAEFTRAAQKFEADLKSH